MFPSSAESFQREIGRSLNGGRPRPAIKLNQSVAIVIAGKQAIKAEQRSALWEFWVVHVEGREGKRGPFLAEIELGLNFCSRSRS